MELFICWIQSRLNMRGFKTYNNSNYNLAALRWLLQTMIELSDRTGEKPQEYVEWKNILEKLHPCPVDKNGYMIASDKPLAKSHRHYSHLLSFYPLRLQDTTRPEINALLEKSIDHWMTIGDGKGLAGYSLRERLRFMHIRGMVRKHMRSYIII